MRNIYLDGKMIESTSIDLPCLIHGKDESGASYFTMNLVLNYVSQGQRILFYSAFKPARDFLIENSQVDNFQVVTSDDEINKNLIIPLSGDIELFQKMLLGKAYGDHIIVVKNIELINTKIIDILKGYNNVVYSGNVLSSQLDQKNTKSKILFSDFEDFDIVGKEPEKYQGLYAGRGVVELK